MPDLPALPYGPKIGRPSRYSAELAALICARITEGESLRKICRDKEMPAASTVFLWLARHEEFSEQYARALPSRADAMAEEIIEIADDGSNDTYTDDQGNERTDNDVIARSRLRVDTRKWLMARMAPKKYGDKITQEHQGPDGGPLTVEIVRLAADVPNPTA